MAEMYLTIASNRIMADPANPRKTFDPGVISQIAKSLTSRGFLQPIRVIFDEQRQCYRVVVGENRLRAAMQAGITEIPCIVVEGEPDDAALLADRLIENVCRNDLRPLELARGIALLKRLRRFNSQEAAAELGLSSATICRAESLLSLPEEVQAMVDSGDLAESVAYTISRLDSEDAMREVANTVVRCRLNRDQAHELCQSRGVPKRPAAAKGERVAGKTPEGVSFSFSFQTGQLVTRDALLKALDAIKAKLKEMKGDGKDGAALADVLKAS